MLSGSSVAEEVEIDIIEVLEPVDMNIIDMLELLDIDNGDTVELLDTDPIGMLELPDMVIAELLDIDIIDVVELDDIDITDTLELDKFGTVDMSELLDMDIVDMPELLDVDIVGMLELLDTDIMDMVDTLAEDMLLMVPGSTISDDEVDSLVILLEKVSDVAGEGPAEPDEKLDVETVSVSVCDGCELDSGKPLVDSTALVEDPVGSENSEERLAVLIVDVLPGGSVVGARKFGFGCLDSRTLAKHDSPAIAPAVIAMQFGSVGGLK